MWPPAPSPGASPCTRAILMPLWAGLTGLLSPTRHFLAPMCARPTPGATKRGISVPCQPLCWLPIAPALAAKRWPWCCPGKRSTNGASPWPSRATTFTGAAPCIRWPANPSRCEPCCNGAANPGRLTAQSSYFVSPMAAGRRRFVHWAGIFTSTSNQRLWPRRKSWYPFAFTFFRELMRGQRVERR